MNILVLIMFGMVIITTLVSLFTTMTMINIRRQVNKIISDHNDIIHMLEEENRVLLNRLLSVPNEILVSIEKMINKNSNINNKDIKPFIDPNKIWPNNISSDSSDIKPH